ncbi:MAG: metallophosphoesterase [Symbiopectobacterium sp.]
MNTHQRDAALNTHQRDAALVVISGDLSDDGSAESCIALADTLAELQVPWRVTLGNHDD